MQGFEWLLDFERFAPACLRVENRDDESRLTPLRFTDIQREFVKQMAQQRLLVLKARQVRISTMCLAMNFHRAITKTGSHCVTVAQSGDATKKLFNRVKIMHREMPVRIPIDKNNVKELSFSGMDSWYYIGTAGSRQFGRSDTLHRIHLTEFAFWESWEVFTGITQALAPDGSVVIESTPNGFNYFYDFVQRAKMGAVPYKLLFFPWFVDRSYRDAAGVPENEWTDEERVVARKAATHGVALDGHQVAWRRRRWAELVDDGGRSKFAQEYPEDDQTCFVSSGRPRFDVERLNGLLAECGATPLVERRQVDGTALTLKVWEKPAPGESYILGADSAEGVSAGDNCDACVIERRTMRKVASLWGKADLFVYGAELVKLARAYNNALLAAERNGVGIATLKAVEGYPNLFYATSEDGRVKDVPGWETTSATRPVMVDRLAEFYRNASATQVRDTDEIGEAMAFVIGSRGRAEAANGAHDDKVMGRGIALMARDLSSAPVGELKRTREWSARQR